jgi:hypothetical protein
MTAATTPAVARLEERLQVLGGRILPYDHALITETLQRSQEGNPAYHHDIRRKGIVIANLAATPPYSQDPKSQELLREVYELFLKG